MSECKGICFIVSFVKPLHSQDIVLVTVSRRLRIGRSRPIQSLRYIVTCTRHGTCIADEGLDDITQYTDEIETNNLISLL